MQKTITTNTFKGPIATTYELVKHHVGTPSEWWAIMAIERDGKSLQNEWGGYSVRNTGCPAYIKKVWKNPLCSKNVT